MTRFVRAHGARLALVVCVAALAACGEPAPTPEETAPIASPAAAVEDSFDPMAELRAGAPAGRLPDGVRPTFYALDMTIDPRQERFSGIARIDVTFGTAAEGLWLHGRDLSVSGAAVVLEGREEPIPALYEQHTPTGVARLSFFEEVPAGPAQLTLTFDAAFDPNLAGMFRVREGEDWYALVKSESIQARRAFPGFDEPRFKTPFAITLTVPEGQAAVANSPEASREPAGDGMERVSFDVTAPLPTFLLSMAVGPFEMVERSAIPPSAVREYAVPLRGFARQGKGAELAAVLDLTPPFIAAFEDAFGVPYPYAKLDIVAAPDWPSGATELAAAPTYREELILLGDNPSPGAVRRMVGLHAHELAHMWFGDYVTPPWWDDLWLKEAFAVWSEPMSGQIVGPGSGFDLDLIVDGLAGMRADSLANARAVREPIERNEVIRSAYDRITYAKGPAVLQMVQSYFGEDSWRAGLTNYFATHGDGVADANDFYTAMAEASGNPDIIEIFRDFIERPGVPVVATRLSCPANGAPQIALTQTRYRPLGSAIDPDRTWAIPACVSFGADEGRGRACMVAREPSALMELDDGAPCPSWVMPNAGGVGYYRFTLDEDGWAALAAAFADLEHGEQLAAIDSVTAAFSAGEADAAAALTIIDAATRAERREVVTAAAYWLGRDAAHVLEGDDAGAAALAAFIRQAFAARREALASAPEPDAALLHHTLTEVLAGAGGDGELRDALAASAARFVGLDGDRDPTALDQDRYALAARLAVEAHGGDFMQAVLETRDDVDDPAFDRAALQALGFADDPQTAAEVRAFAMSDAAPARDAFGILAAQLANAETRDVAWAWLQEELELVSGKVPGQWRLRLPSLASSFCSAERSEELAALFAQNADLAPGHERALAETRERIALCAAQRQDLAAGLASALAARQQGGDTL